MFVDKRPTDYIYALMSQQVCENTKLKITDNLPNHANWIIEEIRDCANGYFGVIYVNNIDKQVVLAHRGLNAFSEYKKELNDINPNSFNVQKEEAFDFLKVAIKISTEIHGSLSFTGYSLGGVLAELCIFYCESNPHLAQAHVNSVIFDSPGSKEIISNMQNNQYNLHVINLRKLDCIEYVVYPNNVNTFGSHIGTLFYLKNRIKGQVNHNIEQILDLLHNKQSAKVSYIKHWPNNYKSVSSNKMKDFLDDYLNYDEALPLKHFSPNFKKFLNTFYQYRIDAYLKNFKEADFRDELLKLNFDQNIVEYLLDYQIRDDFAMKYLCVKNIINFRLELSTWLEEHGIYNFTQTKDYLLSTRKEITERMIRGQPVIWPKDKLIRQESLFVGQKKTLENLHFALNPYNINNNNNLSSAPLIVVCTGLSGIGKTQLILKYVKEFIGEYKICIWFAAENFEILQQNYIQLFLELSGESKKVSFHEALEFINNWLSKNSNWLLIYDHAATYEAIKAFLPYRPRAVRF